MAEISPSAVNAQIPLSAQAPKFDPLATVGQYNDVQKGLLSNRLLQGQFPIQAEEQKQAKLKTATDTQALTRSEIDTFLKKAAPTASFLLGMVANKDQEPLTAENIKAGVVHNLFDTGALDTRDPHDVQLATAVLGQLQPGDTPDALAHNQMILTRLYQGLNSTAEGYNLTLGTPTAVKTGPATVIKRLGGIGAPTQEGATFEHELGPEQKILPAPPLVEQSGPMAGVPQARSVGQAFDARGDVRPTPGGGSSGTLGPTALPPGKAAAMLETGKESALQANELTRNARAVPDRRAALSNLMATLKDFTPGPKADLTYQLGALATQFGLAAPKQAKGVAAQEEFNKLATQIALAQFSALGGTGANEQLATTLKANPNHAMSEMGIKGVAALLQGNNDAIDAMNNAWQKYSKVKGADSYQSFVNEWNQHYDPRVFQYLHLDRKAQLEMLSSMSKKELARFKAGANLATALGY